MLSPVKARGLGVAMAAGALALPLAGVSKTRTRIIYRTRVPTQCNTAILYAGRIIAKQRAVIGAGLQGTPTFLAVLDLSAAELDAWSTIYTGKSVECTNGGHPYIP